MLLLDELEEDGTLEVELDGVLEELLLEEELLLLEELEEDELLLDELELLLEEELELLLEVSLEVVLLVDVFDSVDSTLLVDDSSLEEDSVSELVGGSVL